MDVFAASLGIVIGYLLRTPAKETIERVRVEYVDKPVIVEKLRVERIDVPVIVKEATLQIERVDVPYVVEKPTLQIEHVEVEKIVERPVGDRAVVPPVPVTTVDVVFMDASEREVHGSATLDARLRRPVMVRGGQKYQCARQAADGAWVYRKVRH